MSGAQRYGEIADGIRTAATAQQTQREAERIGRLVLALSDRGHDAHVSVLSASSGRVSVTVWHKAGPASITAYGDGLASLPAVLDTAIDRIDREDWSQ